MQTNPFKIWRTIIVQGFLPFICLLAGTSITQGQSSIPSNGLQLWLKADVGVSLNGTEVSSWADQSVNQYVLSQTNPNAQPQLVPNVLNGKPILRFSGDILQTASGVDIFGGSTSWTVFLVTKPGTSQSQYTDILDQQHDSYGGFAIEQNGGTNQYGL
jgi:hypothetical protein